MTSPHPGATKSHLIRTKDISNSQKFPRVWSFSVRNQSQRPNLRTKGALYTLITSEFPRVLGVLYQDLGAEIKIFSFISQNTHTHTCTHTHILFVLFLWRTLTNTIIRNININTKWH